MKRDPILHTFATDGLPDDHPLAFSFVYCSRCKNTMVHAGNNECVTEWVETGKGPYCLPCFVIEVEDDLDDELGLPG